MPKPILKSHNIITLINDNISLMKELDKSININIRSSSDNIFIKCDYDQFSRMFINLFKNSIESLNEKFNKNPNFTKKIDIEITKKDDYIEITINDNGLGFDKKDTNDLLKPYFTTKKNGTGLGLPIINKIINDHNGYLKLLPKNSGAEIKIQLPL